MKIFKSIFLLLLSMAIFSVKCKADEFSIGIGYPYISTKYGNKQVAGELKGAFGYGIQLYAGRFYINFLEVNRVRLFTGLEAGYISFSDLYDISGKGWELGVFAGIETFVTDWFSVALDFAPTFIDVRSGNDNDEGFEFIVNLAVNLFPFKNKRKVFKQEPLAEKGEMKQIVIPAQNKEAVSAKECKDLSAFAAVGENEQSPAAKAKPASEMRGIEGIILTEDIEIIE